MPPTRSTHAHVLLSITLALVAVFVASTGAVVADTTHAAATNHSTVEITSPNATATADGTITGETTLAAGTQLRVRIRADTNVSQLFLLAENVSVQENGTFQATFNLSAYDPGDEYQVTVLGRNNDTLESTVLRRTEGTLQTPTTPTASETPPSTLSETSTPTLSETSTPMESETASSTLSETPTPTKSETSTPRASEAQTGLAGTTTDRETTTGAPGFTAVLTLVAVAVGSVGLRRR